MDKDWAYFLGLMWADGSVSENHYSRKAKRSESKKTYRARLGLKDRDHLELVARRLNLSGTVTESAPGFYECCCGGTEMSRRLMDAGIIPNKSTLNPPMPQVPDEVFHHFVRGWFDGDGSVGLYFNSTTERWRCVWTIYGSREACFDLSLKLSKYDFLVSPYQKTSKLWEVRFADSIVILDLVNWMYRDADGLYLDRKKEVSDQIRAIGFRRKKVKFKRQCQADFIRQNAKRGSKWIAKQLNVPRHYISSHAAKLRISVKVRV